MREQAENEEIAKIFRTAFRKAKIAAEALGHAADFYPNRNDTDFSESDLLRESAWVILCSGFRERVVRRVFGNLSICFCNWVSAKCIFDKRDICRETALDVFRNERKINGIIGLAEKIHFDGFEKIRSQITLDPILTLRDFKYIGPVTAFHLAKNLGFQVAKPDRHLQMITEYSGFSDVHELCAKIASITDEPVAVVDGVLWRLAERGLIEQFDIFELTRTLRPPHCRPLAPKTTA